MAPIIYLIPYGEEDSEGLSAQGTTRAQHLGEIFGSDNSSYKIGCIYADKEGNDKKRSFNTVSPLASKISLEVIQEDADSVATAAKSYSGENNVLICWDPEALGKIAESIGAKEYKDYPDKKIKYPSSRFDIIWTIEEPYDKITNVSSENCDKLGDDADAIVPVDDGAELGPDEGDGPDEDKGNDPEDKGNDPEDAHNDGAHNDGAHNDGGDGDGGDGDEGGDK